MKKRVLLSLVLVLNFVGQSYAATISLGVIYNTKGSQAALDSQSLKGAQLAVARINDSGGLFGKKLVLVIKQTNSQTVNVKTVANQLAVNPVVNVVIGLSDNHMVQAAAPSVLHAGKIFVSSGATGAKLRTQFPRNFFLTTFTDNVQAAAAAQFVASQMHRTRAVVLYQKNMSYAKDLAGYFNSAYLHFKGNVLATIAFTGNTFNANQLQTLKRLKPGAIFLAASPDNVSGLIQQIRADKVKQPIIGGDSYLAADITPLGVSTADNIYFTTHGYYDKGFMEPSMSTFIREYRKKYGKQPSSIYSALGYDAVNMIVAAMKKAKSSQPLKVTAALKSMKAYDAVTGELDLSNNSANKIVTVVKILSAKARIAAMVIPPFIPTELSYPNLTKPAIKQS